MTGYSRVETKSSGLTVAVELKSLNGRFLEINCRLPRSLSRREFEIRDLIKKNVSRGNVYVSVTVDEEAGTTSFKIDPEAAKSVYDNLTELKKKLKIREQIKFEHIIQFASYFQDKGGEEDDGSLWNLTLKALRKAVRELNETRKKEGARIMRDIKSRVKKIANSVEKIDELGLERIPARREKLRAKIAQLFESDEIDEQRLQMEIALLADKLDITEECVRMRSHVKFFEDVAKNSDKEPIGKKINFILQEMHREINTISSKSDDAEISKIAVLAKEEIEKIREQIQNIE